MNLEQLFQSQQQLLSVYAADAQKPVNETLNLGVSVSSSKNDEIPWGSVSAESKQKETQNMIL